MIHMLTLGISCNIIVCFLILSQVIFKMVEQNPRDVGFDMDGLNIVYGDESLSRLYENSRVSSDQFSSQPGKLTYFIYKYT